ncbi:MAG: orotate phosphoribosyltransferase [Oscillospiraceae bacterium]|nr:orotate phosphoribosyltransferase [Oscillospiraceae bacterium]MDD3832799.1 orotate phosphoribosyltransferase [Oscillospiraceae bacterium]MDD4546564.1 orotate phosphoribosyltransferase [Oscillospiraceae bacterium]
METRLQEIRSKASKNIKIGLIPGHFATNHSHVNYYVDLTSIKSRHKMAKAAAEELAKQYLTSTPIDTIICLEGTEMVGAFLADALAQSGTLIMNSGNDICVLTPELNSNNQMIFRDNTQKMVWGKNILLLIASASTGKTINRSIDCLQYYSGRLVGIAAVFSAIRESHDLPVNAIFTEEDIPEYNSMPTMECKMCKNKRKIDAIVNSYGYSKV